MEYLIIVPKSELSQSLSGGEDAHNASPKAASLRLRGVLFGRRTLRRLTVRVGIGWFFFVYFRLKEGHFTAVEFHINQFSNCVEQLDTVFRKLHITPLTFQELFAVFVFHIFFLILFCIKGKNQMP